MEILAIIPARGGSKGIKRKNLRPICSKPLVAYSIEAGLNSKYITRTVVSTEDSEIARVSESFGAQVIKRPCELARDETKTIPVMLHTASYLEEKEGYKPDYIVLLQPTCPLRDAKYIDSAFEFYFQKEKEGFDSCFSAFTLGTTHAKWKIEHDGSAKGLYDYRTRPRRQDANEHYQMVCENGAFYALKRDTMFEVNDFIGYNPAVYITPRVVDIDTEEDILCIEKQLAAKS